MCTSIISNRKKTIVGWNLDILGKEYQVETSENGVYIKIFDEKEGWMPMFGANKNGDFIGMPTCWPHDARSNPTGKEHNVILLDIDLLLMKKSFEEIRQIAENEPVCSIPGYTFMSSLSDKNGNVLHIVPGQGVNYYERPEYKILANFSTFKMNKEMHPMMGWDRYQIGDKMLREANENFDVEDCFEVLKAVSQTEYPTVVSMVFDVQEMTVYWCEQRQWENKKKWKLL